MSNLENLTTKIMQDCQQQAQQITDAARQEAENILENHRRQAQLEQEKILQDAQVQAKHQAQQLILGRSLAVRDENLAAKQQMLDKVFAAAGQRLEQLPKEQFLDFVCRMVQQQDLEGQQIILPEGYGEQEVATINSYLKEHGNQGQLSLCQQPGRKVAGGFVLVRDGVEQNNTFVSLLEHYRYELESKVIQALD